jgi:hypothetical protein
MVIGREDAGLVVKKDPMVRSFLLPFVRDKDIVPYGPVRTEQYLIVIPKGTTKILAGKHRDPAAWFSRHHTTFFSILSKYYGSGEESTPLPAGCWWEWQGKLPPQFLRGAVLLFSRGTGRSPPGWTLSPEGAYPGPGVVALPARDRSMIGILNSNVFRFYILYSGGRTDMTGYRDRWLSDFPLYIPDPEQDEDRDRYSAIGGLVTYRLALAPAPGHGISGKEKSFAGAVRVNGIPDETGKTDLAINRAVYELYRITAADIAEIEYLLSEYTRE